MANVLVFLADGFEEMEAVVSIDVLRRADARVTTVSLGASPHVTGSHAITMHADALVSQLPETPDDSFDLILLPGGMPGTTNLAESEIVRKWVARQVRSDRWTAAICAAPMALAASGVLENRTFTSHPFVRSRLETLPGCAYSESRVVIDGKLVTSRGPGTAFEFALMLVEVLYGKEKASALAEAMLVKA